MALQQTVLIDKIEIIENGVIQVRQRNDIYDDTAPNNIIASQYQRWVLVPGENISNQNSQIQSVANAIWTPAVISAYQESIKTS